MDFLTAYQTQQKHYQSLFDTENRRHQQLSIARLLCIGVVLWGLYGYYREASLFALGIALLAFIGFLILVKFYDKVSKKLALYQKILVVNTHELAYLNEGELPFDDGSVFINPSHPYSYDLDIFGNRSLFQHINRTANFIGKEKLAAHFIADFSKKEIEDNQKAVEELRDMIDWRQRFYAIGLLNPDNQAAVKRLLVWCQTPAKTFSPVVRLLSYIFPLAFVASVVAFFMTEGDLFYNLIKLFFGLNIGLTALILNE